jgi:tRNA(Ser,Leu) C12 N-acetylase TAN1
MKSMGSTQSPTASPRSREETKEPLADWNVLATAFMRKERFLLRSLRELGDFRGSGFRDVIIGSVESREAFFESIERLRREHPGRLRHLSQIVPVDKTFRFEVADFTDKLKEALAPYSETLENGSSFFIRVKRRGHKGELSSLDIEQKMSAFIIDRMEKTGRHAQVHFEDPDKILVVEIIGNRAGIGLIPRTLKRRYPFIRVK